MREELGFYGKGEVPKLKEIFFFYLMVTPNKAKQATLSVVITSETSTSMSHSLKDLLVHKPSLNTEIDFRKMSDSETKNDTDHINKMKSGVAVGRGVNDEELEDVADSTLLTLRGVCCAKTALQEKLLEPNDTVKSPDRLLCSKYTGRRHPFVSSFHPILSTRTPMSPTLSTYDSSGTMSPAETSSPLCPEKKLFLPHVNTVSSTDPEVTTVKFKDCDMDVATSSKAIDYSRVTLHDILSSADGFSGSLLRTWFGASCSDDDVKSERFVQQFCNSLLRVGLLVKKSRADTEMSGKDGSPSNGRNIFNRLKFVPSQIYTWGPFSRLTSNSNGHSPNKVSTYKDYAVRQVEINPTVAAAKICAATVENGVKLNESDNSLPESTNSELLTPCTNDSQDSSCAASTTCSSSFPPQNGSGDPLSENTTLVPVVVGNPTSPSGSNSTKKLENAWPPPQPEEDDVHKLKYTEAEHQHELMVLKRNHTEELYTITKDYETNIYEMDEEHTLDIESMQKETNLMRQEIAYLKEKLYADKQDASTQTQNVAQLRMSKGIQVNLTEEFPPPQITLPTAEDIALSPAVLAAPPPPPPPPAPPCPVPPPPPTGGPPSAPGFSPAKRDPLKRAPIEPKKPMKPLYWKRIQIPKKELRSHKSVWSRIEDLPLNVEEVEYTFCKATTSKKSKALSDLMTEKKKIMPAKVLDDKRSQAVGIFLSSLHVEMADLKQAILNLDATTVDEENMKAIYDLRASKKEVEDIKSLKDGQKSKKDDEKQPLDKPEKFLYSLSQIDHFDERMYCITFRTTFYEDVQALEKELTHINNALQELQDENTVLRVLGLVLSIGNYLNGGNRTRGQADGFQLDILSKLKDVKGLRDNKNFSLLNYLAWVYLRKHDQDVKMEYRVCPVPTFQSIALASQVDFNNFSKHLKRMQKELKECEKKVTTVVKKAKEHKQPFKDIMEDFLDEAYTNLERQEEDFMVTQKRYKEVLDFYCIKSKSSSKLVEPKEFFALWQSFCMDFHAIWKVELKRFIKAEQQEAEIKVVKFRERQATTVHANQRMRPNGLKSKLMRSRSRSLHA